MGATLLVNPEYDLKLLFLEIKMKYNSMKKQAFKDWKRGTKTPQWAKINKRKRIYEPEYYTTLNNLQGTLNFLDHKFDKCNFTINSKKQKVVEISRRELDKQIAFQAQRNGAIIKVRTSFQEITDKGIRTNEEKIDCKIFVDARGVSTLVQKDRTGILSSAQYEIYADWIKKGKVEVIFDQEKYPGFFAWVIPSNEGKGKVGVAGKGINVVEALDSILKEKGKFSTIRKIYAPIWIKGPIEKFVEGKTVIIGDAAGQAKPTTAGGIFTSGMGGVYAGQAISKFLKTNKISDLQEYQKRWTERFGKEFEKQLLVRKILERIDNQTINKLFESITPEITNEISEKDDFDFHI